MPPYHLPTTSRALYRVFIAPNLHRTSAFPLAIATRNNALNQPPIRNKHYKKDTRRHALSDTYTLDNAIKASRINFVSLDGVYHKNVPLLEAQTSFDKVTNHLVLVSPGKVDQFGYADPDHLPTCKVVSKMDLRVQHQKKLDIERRAAKGMGTGPAPKNLELNWAIAGGDMRHRLGKLREFLGEGRKVEVLLGPKRRGKVASEKECKDVLANIRGAVAECKGAAEIKDPEGVVGGVMTLVFQGKKLEKAEKGNEKGEKATNTLE